MRNLRFFLHLIDTVNERVGRITSFLVMVLVSIVGYEIVSRVMFNNPTRWVHELSGFFLLACAMLGGGYALLHKAHVNVDILYSRFSPRIRAIIDLLTYMVFFLFCGLLVWKSGQHAWFSLSTGETSTSTWMPLIGPVRALIPIGAFLVLLQGLAKFIRDLVIAVTGRQAA